MKKTESISPVIALHAAIFAARDRGDENHAAIAASRGQGSASPNWLSCDDLQAVIDEVGYWDPVVDEDEIAGVLNDAALLMGDDFLAVKAWTVLLRVHSREYVITWRHDDTDIVEIDAAFEWGDGYDGDLPELDPDDYDGAEEMETADHERRRQYWHVYGQIALTREAWERKLESLGCERESVWWEDSEIQAKKWRYRLGDELGWPVKCYVSYECAAFDDDDPDTIEGSGNYNIVD